MTQPEFPTHHFTELQRTKIKIGDPRHQDWGTTYSDSMKSTGIAPNPQKMDTITLQKTHWNAGNLRDEMQSEAHRSFKPPSTNDIHSSTKITTEALMRSSIVLGAGEPMEKRSVNTYVEATVEPTPNYRKQMVSTHFDLKDPASRNWETTNHASFNPKKGDPVQTLDLQQRQGLGAKKSIQNMAAYPHERTVSGDTYKVPSRPMTAQVNGGTRVEDNAISFDQTRTHKWQRTNWSVGSGDSMYTTSMGEATKKRQISTIDPSLAMQKRLALSRSSIGGTTNTEFPKQSVMNSTFTNHLDSRPPNPAERTAYKSHQHFNDWEGVYSTTTKDAYPVQKAERVEQINTHLQDSHASFGHPSINETKTLYGETFKKPNASYQPVEYQKARNFHTEHHSKISGGNTRFETSTNMSTYTNFGPITPVKPCDSLKGGHNVVPNENRFMVTQSAMKSDYQRPTNIPQPTQIDNNLQRSHIHMKGTADEWSTTQTDYFKFKTFKTSSV